MVQQQSTVTISGYVGAEPISFGHSNNPPACSLRIACTPSYYLASEQQWRNKPTTWMTVKAYRGLANNVLRSVHKGDAIVVCGNLNTETWSKDGNDHNRVILEASVIGHDLNRGTTKFVKHSTNNTSNSSVTSSASSDNSQAKHENYEDDENYEDFGGDVDM